MGTLTKAVLGRISGTVGDVLFRQRNGMNYVSARPTSYTPSNDADAVARRKKFAFACKLASNIISISPLKTLWTSAAESGQSAYNKIVSTNYKFVAVDSVTDQTFLVPDLGFGVTTTSITVSASSIQLVTEAIGNNAGIDLTTEKFIQLAAILSLSDPVDETVDDYCVIPLTSSGLKLGLDAAVTAIATMSSQQTQLYNKYNTHKALLSLVTLDVDGNPLHYSGTLVG
jgi:hypothetical protein